MQAKLSTILFDLDGTLLDTVYELHHALNLLFKEENISAVSLEDMKPVISYGSRSIIRHCSNIHDDERLDKLTARFRDIYKENIGENTRFFTGISDVLAFIEQHNLAWGIVTNKLYQHTELLLKKLQVQCACVVGADTTIHKKPHPLPLQHACKLLNTTPEKALFIGDSKIDIMAGNAAGATTVLVKYGYTDQDTLDYLEHADYIVDDPLQLIELIRKLCL